MISNDMNETTVESKLDDRLHRIEGQVRGIEKLLSSGAPAEKIIIQIQAVISSLESTKLELVKKEVKKKMLSEMDNLLNMLK